MTPRPETGAGPGVGLTLRKLHTAFYLLFSWGHIIDIIGKINKYYDLENQPDQPA